MDQISLYQNYNQWGYFRVYQSSIKTRCYNSISPEILTSCNEIICKILPERMCNQEKSVTPCFLKVQQVMSAMKLLAISVSNEI